MPSRALTQDCSLRAQAYLHLARYPLMCAIGTVLAAPSGSLFQTNLVSVRVRGRHAGRGAGHQQCQLVNVMTDKHREPDRSAWNNWCDSRIDSKRSFDRAVLVEVIAELTAMIEDHNTRS
jgi:hypothetical protein